MTVLSLHDLRYSHPDSTPVLDGVSLTLPPGCTGLVGANGSGKSTLLALVAGDLRPSGGSIHCDGRVAVLSQIPATSVSVAELFGCAQELELLRRAERGAASAEELAGAEWDLEARISAALSRVGLSGVDATSAVGCLSGGQRNRAALAAVFFSSPGLVVMDEPTNNLDGEGRDLVAALLASLPGPALVASHDRTLLGQMDHILSLEDCQATLTGGGWEAFQQCQEAARARADARLERAEKAVRTAEQEIAEASKRAAGRARSGKALRRSGSQPKVLLDAAKERAEQAGAGAARLARRRRDAARGEAEAARKAVPVETPRRLEARGAKRSARILLELQDVGFSYPGAKAQVLKDLSMTVFRSDRLALVGANGSGKSTVLKLAAGRLRPGHGDVTVNGTLAYLDQFADVLGKDGPLKAQFRRMHPGLGENAAHAALARMGFRGSASQTDIACLSGGERVQAALALVLAAPEPPDLLILDEPTNHLDLRALEAVEAGLCTYEGALLVVSHDQVFLEQIGVERRLRLHSCG